MIRCLKIILFSVPFLSRSGSNQAKQKYNKNGALLIGDSLGGSLSSAVSNNNDTVYTFNKGAGALFNHNTHNKHD